MTRDEAYRWLGLPPGVKLSDHGVAVVACLDDVPAPIPGDDASYVRSFEAFLANAHAREVQPSTAPPASDALSEALVRAQPQLRGRVHYVNGQPWCDGINHTTQCDPRYTAACEDRHQLQVAAPGPGSRPEPGT